MDTNVSQAVFADMGDADRQHLQKVNPTLYDKLSKAEDAAFMEGFTHDDKSQFSPFPSERERQQAIHKQLYGGR